MIKNTAERIFDVFAYTDIRAVIVNGRVSRTAHSQDILRQFSENVCRLLSGYDLDQRRALLSQAQQNLLTVCATDEERQQVRLAMRAVRRRVDTATKTVYLAYCGQS